MNEERRKVLARLLEKPVDPNEGASDVIMYNYEDASTKTYYNTRTGTTSHDPEGVLSGRPAIFLRERENAHYYGFMAKAEKKHNAVIILFCIFKDGKWETFNRCVIGKGQGEIVKTWTSLEEIEKDFEDIGGASFTVITRPTNVFLESSKALREFAGGGMQLGSIFKTHHVFEKYDDVMALIRTAEQNHQIEYGVAENFMDGIVFNKKPLSEEFKQKLREIYYKNPYIKQRQSIGYLQRCDDDNFVFRTFWVFIKGMPDHEKKTMPLKYIEVKREGISKGLLNAISDEPCSGLPNFCNIWSLGFDKEDIEKSKYSYMVPRLEIQAQKCLEKFKDAAKFNTDPVEKNFFMEEMSYVCYPELEKMASFARPYYTGNYSADSNNLDTNTMYGYIASILRRKISRSCIFNMLGFEVNRDGKNICQVIGAPKAFLQEVAKTSTWRNAIWLIQTVFEGEKEYLMSMNEDDCKKLAEIFATKRTEYSCLNDDTDFMKNIIKVAGIRNFFTAADFAKEIFYNEGKDQFETFVIYIEKLSVVKDYVGKVDWKLSGENLERSEEAITTVYNIMNDKQVYADTTENFRNRFKEWEKYEFEYGEFYITYPKGPSELVEEGIKLHHCVKDFIDAVAEGETTILFIRKKAKPLKPFYTLEICGNTIRQVHGSQNCNVDKCPGLETFIEKFAEAKNIIYNSGDASEMLGVEE